MLEELVGRLLAYVDEASRDVVPEPVATRGEIACRGYLWRVAESASFSVARQAVPELCDRLARGDDPATIASELADAEPLARPDPADGVASWSVPGPGGHVRHFGALASIERAGLDDRRLKRDWLWGFFYRCCEEAAPPPAA